MTTLILGIDSGTQSTKALAIDAGDGKVVGAGSQPYDLIPNLPAGAKEQHPHTWRDATAAAIGVGPETPACIDILSTTPEHMGLRSDEDLDADPSPSKAPSSRQDPNCSRTIAANGRGENGSGGGRRRRRRPQ